MFLNIGNYDPTLSVYLATMPFNTSHFDPLEIIYLFIGFVIAIGIVWYIIRRVFQKEEIEDAKAREQRIQEEEAKLDFLLDYDLYKKPEPSLFAGLFKPFKELMILIRKPGVETILAKPTGMFVSDQEALEMCREINPWAFWRQGSTLSLRLMVYDTYVVCPVPVDGLEILCQIVHSKAERFRKQLRRGQTPPPIACSLAHSEIIDGNHRVWAARLNGYRKIPGLVGLPTVEQWKTMTEVEKNRYKILEKELQGSTFEELVYNRRPTYFTRRPPAKVIQR